MYKITKDTVKQSSVMILKGSRDGDPGMSTTPAAGVICLPFSRGILRTWQLQDVTQLAIAGNSRAVWTNCSDRFPHPYTEADAVQWIQQCLRGTQQTVGVPSQLAVVHQDAGVIGGIGVFHRTDVQRFTKEIGYWLAENFWGKGIMPEVVGVFLQYVWAKFPETARIEGNVYDYNERSAKVLLKHGFKPEGRLVKAAFKSGKFADSLVFGLTRD